MSRPLCILVVEDSEDDVALLLRELRKGGYDPNYVNVCTPEDMRAALREVDWDIVISDWSMPRFNGLDAFRLVKEQGLDIPFIIVSGTIGEEIAVDALKAGVHDFMTKGMFARLVPAVERELRDCQERRRRRDAEIEVERRRNQIVDSERRLRLVIDSVPDGVAVVDADGELVLCNRAAESWMRLGDLARGETRYGFFEPDRTTPREPAADLLARTLRGEQIDGLEMYARHPGAPDGEFLSANTRVLRDASGAVRGAVAVFHDLTREKAANEQLMISDRLASIGMLAAGVAHEINNPLAAVLANLELAQPALAKLAAESPAGAELSEMAEDARSAAERVRHIVRDLRIFAREDGRDGVVEVNRVLESSVRMAWNEIRHRARLVKDLGPPFSVSAVESRLGQVFLNMIVNAAQAIPEGHVETNTIRIATRVDSRGWLAVEIADTGSGIAPEQIGQLFQPFFTTKPIGVGTGLGLAICRRIVDALGGEIEVDSALGRGTTFRVRLPPAPKQSGVAASTAPAIETPAARRGRVLVIDDEPLMGPAIRRILAHDHDVSVNAAARDALAAIEGGARYDVILCDLMMPQMTGMELHAALTQSTPEQARRMVFLTGGAFTPGARAFLERPEIPHLEKPFEPAQLRALVNDRIAAA